MIGLAAAALAYLSYLRGKLDQGLSTQRGADRVARDRDRDLRVLGHRDHSAVLGPRAGEVRRKAPESASPWSSWIRRRSSRLRSPGVEETALRAGAGQTFNYRYRGLRCWWSARTGCSWSRSTGTRPTRRSSYPWTTRSACSSNSRTTRPDSAPGRLDSRGDQGQDLQPRVRQTRPTRSPCRRPTPPDRTISRERTPAPIRHTTRCSGRRTLPKHHERLAAADALLSAANCRQVRLSVHSIVLGVQQS